MEFSSEFLFGALKSWDGQVFQESMPVILNIRLH
jgi:hypothetical protein